MRDIVLEETIYLDFTTRAFASGVPTVLAGTPVLSVLEENNATPITAGVSVSVSRASVAGLNMATIVATAANGYELGKGYSVYISTGTVGGVSVIGEVVAQFTIGASAAAQDLANGTDGLGAIKTDTAAILVDTGTTLDTKINTIDTNVDAVLVDTGTTIPALLGTPAADISADIAAVKVDTAATLVDTAQIGAAGAGLTDLGGMSTGMKAEVNTEADTALTDYDPPTNTEMEARTIVSANYATSSALGTVDSNVDAILVDTGTTIPGLLGTPAADISADIAAVKVDTAAILVDTSTTLDTKINTIDTNVDAVLVDTGTTIPGLLGTPAADVSADIAAVKVDTAAILVDTGTTLDTKINTIDTNVDAVLVDTGTTIPALIGTPAADVSADIAAVKVDTAAIADIPTVAEFNARTLVAASYFDPATDAVANVTLVATTTVLTNVINAASIVASVSGNVDGSVDSVTGDTKQTADHTAGIADIPTVSEFNARTLLAASYFDPAADAVANVTLCATVTDLTNLPAITANWLTAAGIAASALDGKGDWNTTVPDAAGVAPTLTEILTTAMTESYASDGSAPSIAEALFAIQQFLQERSTATTTVTVKKIDGSATAMTLTLDDATTPTSITRTT